MAHPARLGRPTGPLVDLPASLTGLHRASVPRQPLLRLTVDGF